MTLKIINTNCSCLPLRPLNNKGIFSANMRENGRLDMTYFYVAGVSYKRSDAALRGRFAVSKPAYSHLLSQANTVGDISFFIVSTCNRTEIYGMATNVAILKQLLCSATEGSLEEFEEISYCFRGDDAMQHLYNVASGLDSQLLGDFEITGQIKQSVKQSKEAKCLNSFMERMANEVFSACKNIRTNTSFSSGTVSVSFAAIQFIRENVFRAKGKKIVLIGTGKIGTSTCRNIIDYLPGAELTVINRSDEKAFVLAEAHNINFVKYDDLHQSLLDADIVVVASQANEPIISRKDLDEKNAPAFFIDLSIPANVAADVAEVEGVTLVGVDELSKINNETLQQRASQVPAVKEIISKHILAFKAWQAHRADVPKLLSIKNHLQLIALGLTGNETTCPAQKIQKTLDGVAVKFREENTPGCHYLEALTRFIESTN